MVLSFYLNSQVNLFKFIPQLPITTLPSNSSENDVVPSQNVLREPAAPQPGKYYLATGKEFPYCQRHYRFTIQLAKPRNAESWVQGTLNAAIYSDRGAIKNMELTPKGSSARLEHGTTYQVVVTNPHDIGDRIRKVRW